MVYVKFKVMCTELIVMNVIFFILVKLGNFFTSILRNIKVICIIRRDHDRGQNVSKYIIMELFLKLVLMSYIIRERKLKKRKIFEAMYIGPR